MSNEINRYEPTIKKSSKSSRDYYADGVEDPNGVFINIDDLLAWLEANTHIGGVVEGGKVPDFIIASDLKKALGVE